MQSACSCRVKLKFVRTENFQITEDKSIRAFRLDRINAVEWHVLKSTLRMCVCLCVYETWQFHLTIFTTYRLNRLGATLDNR